MKRDGEKILEEKTPEEKLHERLDQIVQHLTRIANADGPVVDEWAREDGSTTFLELAPGVGGSWVLEYVLVVVPTGTTAATLTLGDRTIPLQSSTMNLGPLKVPMASRDKVRVDYGPAAGGCYLQAMGYATQPRISR